MSEIFVALDTDDSVKAVKFAQKVAGKIDGFKIGLELFCSGGPEIVRKIADFGKVFLDLKFHDIPNTMTKASLKVAKLPIFMFNVHALAGYEAMKSVCDEVRKQNDTVKIIAVTMLTSFNKETMEQTGIKADSVFDQVIRLAEMTQKSGLNGVVCSPHEVTEIKKICGKDFMTVVPGIRPAEAEINDQKRVATPSVAKKNGADILIIGRPIYQANEPLAVIESIRKDMEETHAG